MVRNRRRPWIPVTPKEVRRRCGDVEEGLGFRRADPFVPKLDSLILSPKDTRNTRGITSSCRDISKRPPYPLPPEVYDYVDASGQGVTNNTFNIADERTPNPARKNPQEPTHRSRRERLGFQAPKTVHERTTPKIGRKLPPPPKELLPLSSSKEIRLPTSRPTHTGVGQDSRLTENWEYEQLSPMQKYL
ncbi:unnamed protein product [Spodoptera exigua]|nr:unnamed protein product [Spodoptera exigua]